MRLFMMASLDVASEHVCVSGMNLSHERRHGHTRTGTIRPPAQTTYNTIEHPTTKCIVLYNITQININPFKNDIFDTVIYMRLV